MRTLALRRELPSAIALLCLAAFVALVRSDSTPASASGNFDPTASLTLSDQSPGANADSTCSFNVASGDLLGAPVALTPQEATVSPAPASIPGGLGDVVGTLTTSSTAGVSNGPCNFPIAFTMPILNATADNSAGNLIYPSLASEADVAGPLSPLRHDVYTVSPGSGSAGPGSAPSGPANGLPSHVDRYPGFLNDIFDPDGAGPNAPIAPIARYSGSTLVLGSVIVILQAAVFSPGALAAYSPPNTLSDLGDPTLGYAGIVILNDPTADAPVPSLVTDLCSPLGATSTFYGITKTNPCAGNTLPPCHTDDGINNPTPGLPTGRVRYANPASAGTYTWYGFHTSARDLDGDGIENSLDTCPYTANSDGDPRTTSGPDGDMLDSSCDPAPGAANSNEDGDTYPGGSAWLNAADNCPQNPNGTQEQAESAEPDNIAAPRGGSTTDAIGDACDVPETACADALDNDPSFTVFNLTGPDGLVNDGCPTVGSATAELICTFSTALEVDNDLDGYPNDGCPIVGAGEISSTECGNTTDDDGDGLANDGCPATPISGAAEAGPQCGNAADDDGDTVADDGCPESGSQCADAVDDDADTIVNDGCPSAGAVKPESGANCEDFANDDVSSDDAAVNDGCPVQGGPEHGCLNFTDDDGDTVINDGCASSARVANGHYHTVLTVSPKCIGVPADDADGDGWCATGQPGVPNDPDDGMSNRTPETFSQLRFFPVAASGSGNSPPASSEPVQVCNDGIDNDGDGSIDLDDDAAFSGSATTDDCRPPDTVFTSATPDTDGDGSKDRVEVLLRTDALSRCGRGLDPTGTIPNSRWPMDMRGDTAVSADKVTVADLGTFVSAVRRIGTKPGDAAFNRRWDLRPGNNTGAAWITVGDLAVVATTVPPPMYEVRAFGLFSVCSAHKVYGD